LRPRAQGWHPAGFAAPENLTAKMPSLPPLDAAFSASPLLFEETSRGFSAGTTDGGEKGRDPGMDANLTNIEGLK
jgi:hypothetical protein